MSLSVTIYTKPACVQCTATKRLAGKLGLPYSSIDVEAVPEAAEMLRARGFAALPVVIVDDVAPDGAVSEVESWSGFRADAVRRVAAERTAVTSSDGRDGADTMAEH